MWTRGRVHTCVRVCVRVCVYVHTQRVACLDSVSPSFVRSCKIGKLGSNVFLPPTFRSPRLLAQTLSSSLSSRHAISIPIFFVNICPTISRASCISARFLLPFYVLDGLFFRLFFFVPDLEYRGVCRSYWRERSF